MTWREFKKLVDDELEKEGFTEDVYIYYIDVVDPCSDHTMCQPEVSVDKSEGVAVYQ